MYLQFFGLSEPPFSITPDPRFVFLSARHEDGLAHLRYGITQGGGGGFVQLTGEVGTGKTTLSRLLLEDLPEDTEAALVLNPLLGPLELLATICEELGIDIAAVRDSAKGLTDRLNRHLLDAHAAGRTVVVLIDEAQNLSPAALEQVRLLTNLETARQKLLQIILLGQPELRELLARPDLRQLAQRITARFHLTPLSEVETAAYVAHRLEVAGAGRNPFTARALARLHRLTGGVPRLVNIVADRALLVAYAGGRTTIDPAMIDRAEAEVAGRPTGTAPRESPRVALVLVLGAAAVGLAGWWLNERETVRTPSERPAAGGPAVAAAPGVNPPPPVPPAAPGSEPWPLLTRAEAFTALVMLRQLPPVTADAPECPWHPAPGVACLEQRGRIADLARLGRPVVAAVDGGWGIVEVEAGSVAWRAGPEAPRRVDWPTFELRWSGRYVDAWPQPGYVPELLEEGDRGPAVLWVKAAARRATPRFRGDPEDPYFGPALRAWAEAFQREHDLATDGLIGRETLQRLSAVAAPGTAGES